MAETFATAQLEALHYIRDLIISGSYSGGMKINPADVAKRLGCSRIPIREALRQLEAEGFVTMTPNRGATVTTLTPEGVRDLFDIRASLELMAMETAFDRFDDNAFAELTVIRERMDREAANPAKWVEHHDQFHQFIARMSGRERLVSEIVRIHRAVRPYILLHVSSGPTEWPDNNHQMIIDVIRKGDKTEALQMMRRHLEAILLTFVDLLMKRAEGPERRPAA